MFTLPPDFPDGGITNIPGVPMKWRPGTSSPGLGATTGSRASAANSPV
jgi:hypothetical protein